MSNPNPERDERVPQQISLSLCNMCHAVSVGWNNCPHCGAEDWRNVGVYALVDNEPSNDAATRMRDRCVEKVKELRDGSVNATYQSAYNTVIKALGELDANSNSKHSE